MQRDLAPKPNLNEWLHQRRKDAVYFVGAQQLKEMERNGLTVIDRTYLAILEDAYRRQQELLEQALIRAEVA